MRELTSKQLNFAEAILNGTGPSEAYRGAYSTKASARVVSVQAQKVLNHPAVAAYIAKGRQQSKARAQMSRDDKLAVLEDTIRGTKKLDPVQIKAVEVHNVMTGDNAPQEVNIFGLADLLTLVRTKARKP